ncbi:hypothetical protein GCM10027187_18440 [Streptosporangium sandarakinum]|uniref:Uncharacterized protein n=1 Tax=Streptosporangium sandarakinum TaxID=1260955 RepID=A0A852V5M6_9ACTN|nr:hypothetical protein [Streptosporangium sandarakinum]NYF42898.1 hypothetical protein [Streptosporangium sandarakinum]
MATTNDHRTDLARGLVSLAVFTLTHRDVPVPSVVTVTHYAKGSDEEIRAEIDRIAALLGVATDPGDADQNHYTTAVNFGPVTYQAVGILAAARTRHQAQTSHEDCITLDPPVS